MAELTFWTDHRTPLSLRCKLRRLEEFCLEHVRAAQLAASGQFGMPLHATNRTSRPPMHVQCCYPAFGRLARASAVGCGADSSQYRQCRLLVSLVAPLLSPYAAELEYQQIERKGRRRWELKEVLRDMLGFLCPVRVC